jgi:hypothetical protein
MALKGRHKDLICGALSGLIYGLSSRTQGAALGYLVAPLRGYPPIHDPATNHI